MYMRYFKVCDFDNIYECFYEHFNPAQELLDRKWFIYLQEGESKCVTQTKELFGLVQGKTPQE